MLLKNSFLISFLIGLLACVSCIDDTDFDQANDIEIRPEIELDLIFFTLDASRFYDSGTNTENLVVKDTTNLEFLDGSDIKDILKRADFLFEFTNSISREFDVSFDFLSEQNDSKFFTETSVLEGTIETPVLTTFIEEVDEEEVVALTQANKVVVTVTIPSSSQDLVGTLNLQSKTTYYLEID